MFKIGDRVKIRSDLEVNDNTTILKYAGMEANIIGEHSRYKNYYQMNLDCGWTYWNEEIFEDIEIVNKDEFEKFMRS